MRIALCLSGQPRFYKKGYSYLHNYVLTKYNCDIFIHAWHSDSQIGKSYGKTYSGMHNTGFVEKNTINEIVEIYKPVKYQFEEPKNFDTNISFTSSNLANGVDPNAVFSMFYSIYKSNSLKKEYELKNGFIYDLVIRLRFDLKFTNILDIENYEENIVYVSKTINDNPNIYYDIFAYGSSNIMDSYSNIFFDIENIWKADKHFVGENILTGGLGSKSIKVSKIDSFIDLIRAND